MNNVTRKADIVIRWLERLKSAYACGAVESAYLDAECARADLETLRTNIFADVKPRPPAKLPAFLRVITLSIALVMSLAIPLSRENVPIYMEKSEPLALVKAADEPPQQVIRQKRPRRQSTAKRAVKVTEKPKPEPMMKPSKRPAYDKLHVLLETGRRALKTDNTVIKIK